MRFKYSTPDLEFIKLIISSDVLSVSDPDQGVTPGGGNGQDNPEVDPFGDLTP
jgi:hypothetical protein